MLPIGDDEGTASGARIVTIALIALNVLAFFLELGQGSEGAERPDAGVGIGLHLVKRITELHGGHVGVHSTLGEGSTFWVRLPVPAARPKDEPARQAA